MDERLYQEIQRSNEKISLRLTEPKMGRTFKRLLTEKNYIMVQKLVSYQESARQTVRPYILFA
jgi:hypothetical protein